MHAAPGGQLSASFPRSGGSDRSPSLSSSVLEAASGGAFEDTTARIVNKILLVTKWTPPALAARIAVPVTCVEVCVAQETSSQLLRSQLRHWVRRGQNLPPLASSELQALVRDANARESATSAANDSVFDQLDDATREHFEYLRSSMGQNFVSILNDPEAKQTGPWQTAGNDWGSWLSKNLGAPAHALAGDPAALVAGLAGGSAHGPGAAAEVALVAQAVGMFHFDVSERSDFDHYLDDTVQPYRARRSMGTAVRPRVVAALVPSADGTEGAGGANEQAAGVAPLPGDVSAEYAADTFDLESFVRQVLGAGSTAESSPSVTAGASETLDATSCAVDDRTALRRIDVMLDSLDAQHESVSTALMGHVHARSRDFFEASKLFTGLTNETSAAVTLAAETRDEVQDGGASLVHSFLRIAQLSRRRRNLEAIRDAASELSSSSVHLAKVKFAIAEQRYVEAVQALAAARAHFYGPAAPNNRGRTAGQRQAGTAGSPVRLHALSGNADLLSAQERGLRLLLATAVHNHVLSHRWDDLDWEALGNAMAAARSLGALGEVMAQSYVGEAELGAVDAALLPLSSRADGIVGVLCRVEQLRAALQADSTGGADALRRDIMTKAQTTIARLVHQLRAKEFAACVLEAVSSILLFVKHLQGHMGLVAETCDAAFADAERSRQHRDDNNNGAITEDSEEEQGGVHGRWQQAVIGGVAAKAQESIVWFFDARPDESVLGFSPASLAEFVAGIIDRISEVEQRLTSMWLEAGGSVKEAPGLWSRLRGCLAQHVRGLFRRHHDSHLERLIQVLQAETWDHQPSIDNTFALQCAALCASDDATMGVAMCGAINISGRPGHVGGTPIPTDDASRHWHIAFPGTSEAPDPSEARTTATRSGDGSAMLELTPNKFLATNSLLLLLQMLAEHDWFSRRFPMLCQDVVHKVQDALQLFVSQCKVLVLGGGALEGAVDTLTLRHAAVAVQSVAFVAALAPRLQQRLVRLFQHDKTMANARILDRVQRDAVDVRNQLYSWILEPFRQRLRDLPLEPSAWASPTPDGNEMQGHVWIMTIQRECLRHWRKGGLQAAFAETGGPERCVLVSLINLMSGHIREVAERVTSAAAVELVRKHLLVYKTNVEGVLGYGVLWCSGLRNFHEMTNAVTPNVRIEADGAVLDHLGCGAGMDV